MRPINLTTSSPETGSTSFLVHSACISKGLKPSPSTTWPMILAVLTQKLHLYGFSRTRVPSRISRMESEDPGWFSSVAALMLLSSEKASTSMSLQSPKVLFNIRRIVPGKFLSPYERSLYYKVPSDFRNSLHSFDEWCSST